MTEATKPLDALRAELEKHDLRRWSRIESNSPNAPRIILRCYCGWTTTEDSNEAMFGHVAKALAAHAEAAPAYVKCKCSEKQHHCHICEDKTDLACSNCRINFGVSVYVCAKPFCRNEHEHGYCCGPSRRKPTESAPAPGLRESIYEEALRRIVGSPLEPTSHFGIARAALKGASQMARVDREA